MAMTDAASPFSAWKIDHAAIRVPVFDDAVAWYRDKLDFRLVLSAPLGERMFAFLEAPAREGKFVVELIAGPAEPRPAYADLAASFAHAGLHHVAFRVASADVAIDQLRRRGVHIVSEPHDVPVLGLRVAFFADPWSNLFEVIQSIS